MRHRPTRRKPCGPESRIPNVDTSSEKLPPGVSWLPDGPVSISAFPLDWLPAIAENNGVAAKLAVDFQLIAEEVFEAKPIMLRDLLFLLDKISGDAVFHDVADNVVLRRREGKLELNLACTISGPGTARARIGTSTKRIVFRVIRAESDTASI